jgi:hypothetical protein
VRSAGVRRSGHAPVLVFLDDPGGGVFSAPVAAYVSEFFAILGVSFAAKALGFVHLGTAGWVLSLTWAATLNFVAGCHLMV